MIFRSNPIEENGGEVPGALGVAGPRRLALRPIIGIIPVFPVHTANKRAKPRRVLNEHEFKRTMGERNLQPTQSRPVLCHGILGLNPAIELELHRLMSGFQAVYTY